MAIKLVSNVTGMEKKYLDDDISVLIGANCIGITHAEFSEELIYWC